MVQLLTKKTTSYQNDITCPASARSILLPRQIFFPQLLQNRLLDVDVCYFQYNRFGKLIGFFTSYKFSPARISFCNKNQHVCLLFLNIHLHFHITYQYVFGKSIWYRRFENVQIKQQCSVSNCRKISKQLKDFVKTFL